MFSLLRRARRARLLRRPFPTEWLPHLERQVPFYARLDERLRPGFLDKLKCFVWEKQWVGAGGLELTDEIRVVVAATAVQLVLHLDLDYYDRLSEVVVYPGAFKLPDRTGVILGEAKHWGVVVLSWESVLAGLRNPGDGHATAAHEFAHVLDRADGAFDGTPELRRYSHYRQWAQVMSEHYLRLRDRRRPELDVLREYGAQDEAEFFAVATESFFEKPRQMRAKTPALYDAMKQFYGHDPAEELAP